MMALSVLVPGGKQGKIWKVFRVFSSKVCKTETQVQRVLFRQHT